MPRIVFLEQDELPRVYDANFLVASKLRYVVTDKTRDAEAKGDRVGGYRSGGWRQVVKNRIAFQHDETRGQASHILWDGIY